ncbi:MAG TPA: hypothetical protein VKV19_16585 [Ktedonobacteraceae bacterium]|jgi:hypothetical protein|nr:hypothetical protein [Ktedonobacteraceae bacterium]
MRERDLIIGEAGKSRLIEQVMALFAETPARLVALAAGLSPEEI